MRTVPLVLHIMALVPEAFLYSLVHNTGYDIE